MRRIALCVLAASLLTAPVGAAPEITTTGCSNDQVAAIQVAVDFTNRALNRIEMLSLARTNNPHYATWFGVFDAGRAAVVEDVHDRVRGVLNDMQFRCDWPGCPSSAYAWAGGLGCGLGTICLCDQFWRSRPAVSSPILPAGWHPLFGFAEAPCSTSADCPIGQACTFPPPGTSGRSCTNNDSQVVTLAHEMSHFYGTGDAEYGSASCRTLAATDPDTAIKNGDNYGYFAEAVLLGPEMASYLIALY